MWNKWKELCFAAVKKNINTHHLKRKRNVAWITSAIRRLFHKRKRLWKKAKSSQIQSDWEKYKQCRNKVKSEKKRAIGTMFSLFKTVVILNVSGLS